MGTLTGSLARHMLRTLRPKRLTVMDISAYPINMCYTRTKKLGADMGADVQCIRGDSAKSLRQSLPDGSQDLIYIDGDHDYKGVCADLEAARSKLRVGGAHGHERLQLVRD